MITDHYEFDVGILVNTAQSALERAGVNAHDAALVADALVTADRRGIYSHGLMRLPLYVSALESGGMNPRPEMKWRREQGAVAILEADSALGQVAMQEAVGHVKTLAEKYGIGCVAVEHSTHYGAGNYWTDQLAQAGLASLLTSTTGPRVTPFGGRDPILGTNPLTMAFPSLTNHALTADMATSAGAYGKVMAARNAGYAIPKGWAVDPDGDETTDPDSAISGAFLPMGGHKGSALSVMLEAFAASLTHANFAYETTDIWSNPAHKMNTGHLVIALNPELFTGVTDTKKRISGLQERVRAAGHGVQAPGDIEAGLFEASRDRVALSRDTYAQIEQMCGHLGVVPPVPHEKS
ncbi:Ldh family oxidoreductase [Spelaeicoccus albus]|uniref:L-2-hydroxycarboxylate dehydrogenase (NAD+) n=1 Tax=Spelaeicoccus albus TaxID=1280376 RepID=A0A7Z0D4J8_9MICO|nr:Ldh family oxidoreductase [Spelaeicoccus albus]NYI68758.1 L-2-hydroxycarboxylate dehydrogenase (NAD+) [Spelaeicoccus albus]